MYLTGYEINIFVKATLTDIQSIFLGKFLTTSIYTQNTKENKYEEHIPYSVQKHSSLLFMTCGTILLGQN